MIRFATIGTNFITEWFLEAVGYCEGLTYGAAYSRTEETARAFAAKHGAERSCTDLQELAEAQDIDAVYIASPNSLHCEQAILMMQHGKHVLCEKSIASNSRELERMLAAARENQVVLLEAMRPAFDPGLAVIRDYLPKLGKIRRVSFQYGKYSSRYDHFKAGIVENAFDPAFSNGALMDIGVYCVHPLVKLFGSPQKIHAEALMLESSHGSIDGAGTILAQYPDMLADVMYSKICDHRLPSQIQGENGTMLIRDIPNPTDITIHYHNGGQEDIQVGKEGINMIYEVREWYRLMEGHLSGEEHNRYSVMAMELMDEARRQTGLVFPADRTGSL